MFSKYECFKWNVLSSRSNFSGKYSLCNLPRAYCTYHSSADYLKTDICSRKEHGATSFDVSKHLRSKHSRTPWIQPRVGSEKSNKPETKQNIENNTSYFPISVFQPRAKLDPGWEKFGYVTISLPDPSKRLCDDAPHWQLFGRLF